MARAYRQGGRVIGKVELQELEIFDPLAAIRGLSNILVLNTDTMKELAIIENNPSVQQTAFALFSDLDFEGIFTYMIRGNKPIINDSLWQTFVEGFSAFDELAKRTREDFGHIPYRGGVIGCLYLAVKFIALPILKRGRPLSVAHRPLPSMIIATDPGICSSSIPSSRRAAATACGEISTIISGLESSCRG